jgi:ribosome maturation factor RimP
MTQLPIAIQGILKDIENQIGLLGAELVDIDYKKSGGREVLTFTVDKTGGVTLEDCVKINHGLSLWFDELESDSGIGKSIFKGPFNLEVNSPGLDRPLKTEKDFARACGETIRVIWRGQDGKVKVLVGVLGVVENAVLEMKGPNGIIEKIDLAQMVRANREIKIES